MISLLDALVPVDHSLQRPESVLAYRADVADGFIGCVPPAGPARIEADGLGYTNEVGLDPRAQWLYVNETFARRLSRFAVHSDGSLGPRQTVTRFGAGTFPDGLAFDEAGHAWVVSIVSKRLIRVAPVTAARRCGWKTASPCASTPAPPPPSTASLADQACAQIRQRILDKVWPPGHRALEKEVALALGMSRTPVREAMMQLQNEGLVEVVPRHGMRVLPVSPVDMRQIYEILTSLEGAAVEAVARRRPDEAELAPLVDATAAMDRALQADDLDAWARADEHFHRSLVAMAGNRHLQATVMNHWDRAHRARMFSLKLRPKPVNSTPEHMALVERLRAGDAEGAAKVNRQHRERAATELLRILEHDKLQQM